MRVSRRSLLHLGSGVGTSVVALGMTGPTLAAPAIVGLRKLDTRALSFDCCNTGERLNKVTYWAEGKYCPDALAEINYALRDFQTGDVFPIEPTLLDVLNQIGRRLGTDCHFELYSGYRSAKTNAILHRLDPQVATHSLHMKGQAVDISLPGRSLRKVCDAALAMRMGGVGYYPDSEFLHVDVGRVRQWTGLG